KGLPMPAETATTGSLSSLARRRFLVGGLAGAGTAAISLSGLVVGGMAGTAAAAEPVRPPGTLPEDEFLARCVRCAACVVICPENALQPLYDGTGLSGLFSPALVPAGGPCDPTCARCGEVCPTGAIRQLAGDERLWAKTGTAEIVREDCLAWEDREKCMVCDEVCPYDAIVFKFEPGHSVTVPHVVEEKCAGCGYCEHECPVKRPVAIIVRPRDALRLAEGSYERAGQARGFDISLDITKKDGGAQAGYPGVSGQPGGGGETYAPGFDTEPPAPGFDPS
ncbi:MAG: 4Fe-4S dicluster domain-containing protein, partial [Rhodospirillales bacterium]|nr:4Fe-4S dicluster domain-containing protein [Rhodospirillales bacterium]